MSLPSYNSKGRNKKFGSSKTQPHTIRLPIETIQKIDEQNIDIGQIVYDIVEKGFNPYQIKQSNPQSTPASQEEHNLIKKLIALFITNADKIDVGSAGITKSEEKLIEQIAGEIQ